MEPCKTENCLLKKVEKQEIDAKDFGFYWESIDQIIDQITSECAEAREAWLKNDRSHLQEEVGDLIQAAVSLAVYCDLDPRETLRKSIDKFQRRYDHVVELAQQDGHKTLHGQSFPILMDYWNKAKKSS